MAQSLPLVLVPGLTCTARLYGPQIAALWPFGQVAVADHRRDADMAAIAARILEDAPPRFALAGLSMGGYIAFAMLRLAPERIAKLALLDTSARPDTPEQTAGRNTQIAMAQSGRYRRDSGSVDPALSACEASARRTPHGDRAQMVDGNRAGGFRAPAQGDHVAAGFAAAAGVDPLPDAGAGRRRRRSRRRRNSTRKSPPASRARS